MQATMRREHTASMRTQLVRIRSAAFLSPCPIFMLISGAPPIPTRNATEPTIVTTGPQTPAPASAMSPEPGIFPIYMRSTIL